VQDLQDERANPWGKYPVDIQEGEPLSGWDGIVFVRFTAKITCLQFLTELNISILFW